MATRERIAIGEWYHCFNRGVDKRRVFESAADYERFLALLYVCNGTQTVRLADRYNSDLNVVLSDSSIDRGEKLVELGVYVLMPNHIHLLCREVREKGIATFMQKVFTGYTMYFNKKYNRTGALFSGTFKSKHVHDDIYLKQVIAYLLLNPVELFEPKWKEGVGNSKLLMKKLSQYPYSNLSDFLGKAGARGEIVSDLSEYYDVKPSLERLVHDAKNYYLEQSPKV